MEQMTIERELGATGSTTILRLSGPLTLATLFSLQDELREIGNVDTVIDVAGCPYIDSARTWHDSESLGAYAARQQEILFDRSQSAHRGVT
jgi:hypothetical protein